MQKIAFANYIDGEELEGSFEISKETDETCIIVTTLVSGSILEQNYLPLKDGSFFASGSKNGGKNLLVDVLSPEEEFPFMEISGEKIKSHLQRALLLI